MAGMIERDVRGAHARGGRARLPLGDTCRLAGPSEGPALRRAHRVAGALVKEGEARGCICGEAALSEMPEVERDHRGGLDVLGVELGRVAPRRAAPRRNVCGRRWRKPGYAISAEKSRWCRPPGGSRLLDTDGRGNRPVRVRLSPDLDSPVTFLSLAHSDPVAPWASIWQPAAAGFSAGVKEKS